MSDERDRELREEWTEHPQAAFLGSTADIFAVRAGKGPESPEERQAREGAPGAEGPRLDELMAKERRPIVSDFTRGAMAAHEEAEERRGTEEGEEGREPGEV
jgi:hypothetical protein